MTTLTVALIAIDTQRVAVQDAIAALTPNYTVGFLRPCCSASEPNPTCDTLPTHWYANGAKCPSDVVQAWQEPIFDRRDNSPEALGRKTRGLSPAG